MRSNAPFSRAGIMSRLLILLGTVLLSTLLLLIIVSVANLLLPPELSTNSNPGSMKAMQLLSALFTFILPAILMAFLVSRHPAHYLELTRTPNAGKALLTLVSMVMMIPFMNIIIEWNQNIRLPESMQALEFWMLRQEEEMGELTLRMLEAHSVWGWLFNLFLVGVVASFSEEIFFRGMLQNLFRDKWHNRHLAIWLAAFAFSMFHMQFYGLIPRMLLGAYFGYLLVWTRSLWIPIIAHFANNAIALLQIWLQQRGTDPQVWVESNLGSQTWIWGAMSVILFVLTAAFIRRRS